MVSPPAHGTPASPSRHAVTSPHPHPPPQTPPQRSPQTEDQKPLPRLPSHSALSPNTTNPSAFSATQLASSSATSANVKRSRSITFLPIHSPSKSPLTGPWSSSADENTMVESEGPVGETTPIIRSERGGGRDYRAFESLGPPARRPSAVSPSLEGGARSGGKNAERSGNGGKSAEEQGPRRRKMGGRVGSRRASEADDGKGVVGWWGAFMEKYGSVELDNKGSVARDHLALERTFLAWLRTSLAFASIGIAVTQLFRLNTTISEGEGLTPAPGQPGTIRLRQVGKPLGATFLGISILVLILGGRRYFESQYWIIRGKFPASRGSVCMITFVAAALIVTSLIVVCTVPSTQFQGN